jgi:acetylornithine deacetylase
VLSAHTDVVPVEGQAWTSQPFALTRRADKLYGRGTADMKGFVACAIATALQAAEGELQTPLHLALSYDEEIGCVGVHDLLGVLAAAAVRPQLCIVGEPTELRIATGHKGKIAARAVCTSREAHSALAPKAVNAIHLAADFIALLRARQDRLATEGIRDEAFDIAYSTIHAGTIQGGTALNIVPGRCEIEFEIRNLAGDDAQALLETIVRGASEIAMRARQIDPEADIGIETINAYPGLETAAQSSAVRFVGSLAETGSLTKVAFGTEGGLFAERLGVPTLVCGPGSMAQGHKPDEFIAIEQIERCLAMLGSLVSRLRSGVSLAETS